MNIRAACFALFLSLSLGFAAHGEEASPLKAGGAIDNSAVWEGEVLVQRPVSVPAGARLTIRPGTRVRFARGAGLLVQGGLDAAGTPGRPIRFQSAESAPARGDWGGITLAGEGESCRLVGCVISDADAVRASAGSPEIAGCTIGNGNAGLFFDKGSSGKASGNTIEGMSGHGIDCQPGSSPVIDNNTIRDCGLYGIAAQRNASPSVTRNRITRCNTGIWYGAVAPSPEMNRIDNNVAGILLNNVSEGMSVLRNVFTRNKVGLHAENFSNPGIEGNRFEGNETAIICFRSSSPAIVRNLFAGNREGVSCVQLSAPSISANEFRENGTGVLLTLSSYATIRGNNFDNNAVHVKLDNMSHDWEVKVGRKPERGNAARTVTRLEKGMRAPAGADANKAVGEGWIDATGNWWGEKDTAEMKAKGPDANIGSLVDGYDVPTRTYEGYPGEYAQDRIKYEGWAASRIAGAGIRETEREDSPK